MPSSKSCVRDFKCALVIPIPNQKARVLHISFLDYPLSVHVNSIRELEHCQGTRDHDEQDRVGQRSSSTHTTLSTVVRLL